MEAEWNKRKGQVDKAQVFCTEWKRQRVAHYQHVSFARLKAGLCVIDHFGAESPIVVWPVFVMFDTVYCPGPGAPFFSMTFRAAVPNLHRGDAFQAMLLPSVTV